MIVFGRTKLVLFRGMAQNDYASSTKPVGFVKPCRFYGPTVCTQVTALLLGLQMGKSPCFLPTLAKTRKKNARRFRSFNFAQNILI